MIPDELTNGSSIQNNDGMTVAMYLAKNKNYISTEWDHDPAL
jgi:hypothetical protein